MNGKRSRYKKRRRLKPSVKKKLTILFIIILIGVISGIGIKKYYDKINSYPYKLEKAGYSDKESEVLLKKLKDEQLEEILKKKHNKLFDDFVSQKYFIFNNLDKYIEYYTDNSDLEPKYVVSVINVKANIDQYEDVEKTNINKNNLMLVNKHNYLTKEYKPNDLVKVSLQYCYGENEIKKEVMDQFLKMYNDAKLEDLYLIITSAFREYEFQETLWNRYANSQGEAWADSVAARPGYSEHQTGLALDIVTYSSNMNEFENTDEFKWLDKNAHKYGFILRYPDGKEDITGYSYESWHYRYVGVKDATKIKKLGITFDEYYAYYLK